MTGLVFARQELRSVCRHPGKVQLGLQSKTPYLESTFLHLLKGGRWTMHLMLPAGTTGALGLLSNPPHPHITDVLSSNLAEKHTHLLHWPRCYRLRKASHSTVP